MDQELKQHLEAMEARITGTMRDVQAETVSTFTDKMHGMRTEMVTTLTEKMRDMQTELLRGFAAFSEGQTIRL